MNSFFLFSVKFLEFLQLVENYGKFSGSKVFEASSLDSRRREQEIGGETVSLTRTERGVWTRTPTCYSRRPRRLLLDVPCGVEPPGHFARSGNASHHGFQQGSIGLQLFHTKRESSTGNTFRQNFSLVSSILIFRDFLVHSSFLISCYTKIHKNKNKNEHFIFLLHHHGMGKIR